VFPIHATLGEALSSGGTATDGSATDGSAG
jgi:hypothetical protein